MTRLGLEGNFFKRKYKTKQGTPVTEYQFYDRGRIPKVNEPATAKKSPHK